MIWGLSNRKDIRLGVIAEGERAERLKKGCIINGVTYQPDIWTPQEAKGTDLLIVALKYGALPCYGTYQRRDVVQVPAECLQ